MRFTSSIKHTTSMKKKWMRFKSSIKHTTSIGFLRSRAKRVCNLRKKPSKLKKCRRNLTALDILEKHTTRLVLSFSMCLIWWLILSTCQSLIKSILWSSSCSWWLHSCNTSTLLTNSASIEKKILLIKINSAKVYFDQKFTKIINLKIIWIFSKN